MNKIYKHKTLNWIAKAGTKEETKNDFFIEVDGIFYPFFKFGKQLIENSSDWEEVK